MNKDKTVVFKRNNKGIGYLVMGTMDLIKYNQSIDPICDECLKNLHFMKDIILIPILNEAFCNKCGMERLNEIIDYPEDRMIREKRETFYKNFYGIEEAKNE